VRSASTTISCRFALLFALLLIPACIHAKADGIRQPNVLPLATRWSMDLGGPPVARTTAVVDGQRVYVALRAGQIVARNLLDGAETWRRDLPTEQPLAVDGGVVFVSSRDVIHALRGADGVTLWETPLPKITAPLVARAGWLIVLADRRVLAFRSKDGAPIWQRDIGSSTEPPAIEGDRVYISLDDARIVAADITSGKPIWESTIGATPGALFATPDRVYAGASDRQFYCLKAKTGEIEWVKWVGAAIVGPAAVYATRVYFLALDNILRGLDRSNGNQRWLHAYRRRAATGPAIGGSYVFVTSSSSPDIWMWTTDGRPAGSITLPAEPTVPATNPPDARSSDPFFMATAITERGAAQLDVVAVTCNLASQCQLTLLATAGEPPLVPFSELPGVVLKPEARDVPAEPPLVPLTNLPGIVLPLETAVIQGRDVPAFLMRTDASISDRKAAASRATPSSIRCGVGAENARRMVFPAW
jgi:outer membrane protein assembly factor BamB